MTDQPSTRHNDEPLHARILRLTQLYKALSEVNQAIVRMNEEADLFPLVCRVAVEFGGVRMAWIGGLSPQTGRVSPLESYGTGTGYLDDIRIAGSDSVPEGRGPAATALRGNRPVIINHYLQDPMTAPWHAQARQFGWNSSGSFPIQRSGRPFAMLGVYHEAEDFFDDETVALLDEMARDISFALDNFDREAERQAAMDALRTSEQHFRAYFERSMVGMAATCPDRSWMEANNALCAMLGYTIEELSQQTWASLTHPDDLEANEAMFARMHAGELDEYTLDKRFLRKDGGILHVHLAARAIRHPDGTLAYVVSLVEDITARKEAEVRDRIRTRTLERLAKGAPLADIMQEVIANVEHTQPEIACSILLLNETGEQLFTGAAPSLPDFYNEAINGLRIGPGVGSCGTAAYTGERTVVEDISNHPYWPEPYRSIAARAGLGASWSEPIVSASGRVLGTFAIYHRRPTAPDQHRIALIENAAKLVGIAIERRQSEEELYLASMIYRSSSEAMLVTDPENRIVAINPAFTDITGYELEEVRGSDPKLLCSGRHDRDFYRLMWREIEDTGLWQGEIWNRRKNGEIFPEWLTINVIKDEDGNILRYVALGSDITNKVRSDELIWRQANFDFLTELPNRYMFQDRLEQEIRKAHQDGTRFGLLFIDLDRFKDINDSLGHQVGDMLLMEAAERIGRCLPESDTLARLGGDEFTVILTQITDAGDAERIGQQIISVLSEPFRLIGETIYITASIGITIYPVDSKGSAQLLRNADQAMYAAKNAGRNRLSYFTQGLQHAAQHRLRLTNDLRDALPAGQFALQFQPIIDLANSRTVKAEALLRWQHPEQGMISPAEFIPLAEETGLIVEIGDWVFRESARWAGRWSTTAGGELQISVNMSPLQFQSDALSIGDWLDHLRALDVAETNVSIEITEGLLMNANPEVTDKLLAFRDAGIQVAIDDFGTGYSALSYLKRFDIDYLKIDQSFTRNLQPGSNDLILCEAIVMMAHKLGLKVIAEGVETEDQRRLLTDIGCDYGQGYLFSKPLPAEAFERYLTG
ncbi:MAG TPA: EAL domain-containing protein [Gammaproteobacteria bacterium]|nr:EAL domain-containing protein [Gammaproteobacteria bacterium]